jgi:hypothetical protein
MILPDAYYMYPAFFCEIDDSFAEELVIRENILPPKDNLFVGFK